MPLLKRSSGPDVDTESNAPSDTQAKRAKTGVGCMESELLKKLQQQVISLKSEVPGVGEIPGVYKIPLIDFSQQLCDNLNKIGKKLTVDADSGETTDVSLLKSQFEEFVKVLIEVDVHFKIDHPGKLGMWMSHGYAARPKDLGIPHEGGLIDAVLVTNDFCMVIIQCTPDVPLPLYSPLLEHLELYYRNLESQPHVSIHCIAGEIDSLRKFCCNCTTCKQIFSFYGTQHDSARLVVNNDTVAPEDFDQVAKHVFDTKIMKDMNLHLKSNVSPKTLATSLKRKQLVFEKDDAGRAGITVLLHKIRQLNAQIDRR